MTGVFLADEGIKSLFYAKTGNEVTDDRYARKQEMFAALSHQMYDVFITCPAAMLLLH